MLLLSQYGPLGGLLNEDGGAYNMTHPIGRKRTSHVALRLPFFLVVFSTQSLLAQGDAPVVDGRGVVVPFISEAPFGDTWFPWLVLFIFFLTWSLCNFVLTCVNLCFWWRCRSGQCHATKMGNLPTLCPTEILLTRFGECYHPDPGCDTLANSTTIVRKRLCTKCGVGKSSKQN
jgi:hypothetical protein